MNLLLHVLSVGAQNNLTARQLVVSRNTAVRPVVRRLLEGGTSEKICRPSKLALRLPGAWSTAQNPRLLWDMYRVLKQS